MTKQQPFTHFYFWLLVLATLILVSLGLFFSRGSLIIWGTLFWQVCQSGTPQVAQRVVAHFPFSWQMVIPIVLLLTITRAALSLTQQLSATQRLARRFLPLRHTPPARLLVLVKKQGLQTDDIVFLDLNTLHAFCLGFWRPRIWLTAGLVDLLSDEELAAVLAHEAHHLRRRDPARLLLNRTIRAAFFFLPVMRDLAQAAELQQEVAADRHAISTSGDDLPLLCALQKLLKYGQPSTLTANVAAYTPFNLTEARLKRLIYPPTPIDWSRYLLRSMVNLAVIIALSSALYFSCTRTALNQAEIAACLVDLNGDRQSELPFGSYEVVR